MLFLFCSPVMNKTLAVSLVRRLLLPCGRALPGAVCFEVTAHAPDQSSGGFDLCKSSWLQSAQYVKSCSQKTAGDTCVTSDDRWEEQTWQA